MIFISVEKKTVCVSVWASGNSLLSTSHEHPFAGLTWGRSNYGGGKESKDLDETYGIKNTNPIRSS